MVAARAGTSVSTVSLVVNGKAAGRVSAEKVRQVWDAVDELGYVVDHAASSLASGRSDLIVLIAPDLWNPFFGQVISGIRSVLVGRYRLLLAVPERRGLPSADDLRRVAAIRPAGLLTYAPERGLVETLGQFPYPVVLMDAPGVPVGAEVGGEPVDVVNFDVGPGVDQLVDHLWAGGHRTVAYLDSFTGSATFTVRQELFRRSCLRRGVQVLDEVFHVDLEMESSVAAVRQALPRWVAAGASAVVVANDTIAYGVLAAAAEVGVRVPEDLAVTGFDDLPTSMICAPALTSVSLPGQGLGEAAARLLLDRVEGRESGEVPVLPARLVVRASSGS
ncbi:transcriptional regulator, LacI family [Austwickia chelonae]|uniref:Putative LacI family transcriptional regulator n=2 Tax=Austwickia TaxID=1184606 RepID=K6VV55_9MICO|nr:putative LacI family transcriptional regulator [Austwickia chelonae NBRC 105200]SEW37340.1 transcriptional regulator, LacI family [Austwickia chelonae]